MSRLALVPTNVPSLASAPTTPTLQAGDLYFDSTLQAVQVYSGSGWLALGGSSATALIFTGFNGGSATDTVFDLTLDLGAAA